MSRLSTSTSRFNGLSSAVHSMSGPNPFGEHSFFLLSGADAETTEPIGFGTTSAQPDEPWIRGGIVAVQELKVQYRKAG